jgi:hypothetical protein
LLVLPFQVIIETKAYSIGGFYHFCDWSRMPKAEQEITA